MVVGVLHALEEGKVYSLEDLSDRFGLEGSDLLCVVDHLMERGRIAPLAFDRYARTGQPVEVCARLDHELAWRA